jgi:iron(III) transport system ATP-binding protein
VAAHDGAPERGLSAEAPPPQRRGGDINAKVNETLELVGLGDYAERPVVVAVGRPDAARGAGAQPGLSPAAAAARRAALNLDAKLRIRLRDELRRILKQTGMTGLYVTHDQAEAVVLGDRIGVMRDGKLLQMAPPARSTTAGRFLRRQLHRRLQRAAGQGAGAQRRARHHRSRRRRQIEAWTPQPLSAATRRAWRCAPRTCGWASGPANVFSGR